MFDNYISRQESITCHTTVTEKRAPTDESVRILRDMEERAEKKIINAVRVANTPVEMVIHTMKDFLTGDVIYACVFKINGHQKRVDYRACQENDKATVAVGIRDAVAKEIATILVSETISEAFKNL